MAWVDLPITDTDLDSPVKTGLLLKMRDNDRALRITVIAQEMAEQSDTVSVYTAAAFSFFLFIPDLPDYIGYQRKFTFNCEMKVSGGGTGTLKVRDNASATDSTEATTTNGTYEEKEVVLNVDSAWKGTTRTIEVWMKKSGGGSVESQVVNRACHRLEY